MKARTIDFTHPIRTGPKYSDRTDKLRLDSPGFKGGTIDVQVKERIVRIWNPACDPVTKEPVEVFLPMDRVVGWEPLSKAQEAIFYPSEPKEGEAA